MKWYNILRTDFMIVVSFLMLICTSRVYAQAGNHDVDPPKDLVSLKGLIRITTGESQRTNLMVPKSILTTWIKTEMVILMKLKRPTDLHLGRVALGSANIDSVLATILTKGKNLL